MGLDEEIEELAVRIERAIQEGEERLAEHRSTGFDDRPFDTTNLEFGESARGR